MSAKFNLRTFFVVIFPLITFSCGTGLAHKKPQAKKVIKSTRQKLEGPHTKPNAIVPARKQSSLREVKVEDFIYPISTRELKERVIATINSYHDQAQKSRLAYTENAKAMKEEMETARAIFNDGFEYGRKYYLTEENTLDLKTFFNNEELREKFQKDLVKARYHILEDNDDFTIIAYGGSNFHLQRNKYGATLKVTTLRNVEREPLKLGFDFSTLLYEKLPISINTGAIQWSRSHALHGKRDMNHELAVYKTYNEGLK